MAYKTRISNRRVHKLCRSQDTTKIMNLQCLFSIWNNPQAKISKKRWRWNHCDSIQNVKEKMYIWNNPQNKQWHAKKSSGAEHMDWTYAFREKGSFCPFLQGEMEIISPYTSVPTGAYMSRVSLPESPDNKGAKRSVQFVRPDRIIKATWQPSQCIKSSLIERNIPTIMGVPEMQSTHLLHIPFNLIMSINSTFAWTGVDINTYQLMKSTKKRFGEEKSPNQRLQWNHSICGSKMCTGFQFDFITQFRKHEFQIKEFTSCAWAKMQKKRGIHTTKKRCYGKGKTTHPKGYNAAKEIDQNIAQKGQISRASFYNLLQERYQTLLKKARKV